VKHLSHVWTINLSVIFCLGLARKYIFLILLLSSRNSKHSIYTLKSNVSLEVILVANCVYWRMEKLGQFMSPLTAFKNEKRTLLSR
jgi:hypothetical protein